MEFLFLNQGLGDTYSSVKEQTITDFQPSILTFKSIDLFIYNCLYSILVLLSPLITTIDLGTNYINSIYALEDNLVNISGQIDFFGDFGSRFMAGIFGIYTLLFLNAFLCAGCTVMKGDKCFCRCFCLHMTCWSILSSTIILIFFGILFGLMAFAVNYLILDFIIGNSLREAAKYSRRSFLPKKGFKRYQATIQIRAGKEEEPVL